MQIKALFITAAVTILGTMSSTNALAADSTCKARCVLLQQGAEANFQIEVIKPLRRIKSDTIFDTILLADLGEKSASSLAQLETECKLAGEVWLKSTLHPFTQDKLAPTLVSEIDVDKTDGLAVVLQTHLKKTCD